jgi:hypothetical protein
MRLVRQVPIPLRPSGTSRQLQGRCFALLLSVPAFSATLLPDNSAFTDSGDHGLTWHSLGDLPSGAANSLAAAPGSAQVFYAAWTSALATDAVEYAYLVSGTALQTITPHPQ